VANLFLKRAKILAKKLGGPENNQISLVFLEVANFYKDFINHAFQQSLCGQFFKPWRA
jgi:hypothetical protein